MWTASKAARAGKFSPNFKLFFLTAIVLACYFPPPFELFLPAAAGMADSTFGGTAAKGAILHALATGCVRGGGPGGLEREYSHIHVQIHHHEKYRKDIPGNNLHVDLSRMRNRRPDGCHGWILSFRFAHEDRIHIWLMKIDWWKSYQITSVLQCWIQ
jgi:hypothetical protein